MWQGARFGGWEIEVVEDPVGVLEGWKRGLGGRGRRRRFVMANVVGVVEKRDGRCVLWWEGRICWLESGDEGRRMVGDRRGHGDKGSDCEDRELSIGIRVTVLVKGWRWNTFPGPESDDSFFFSWSTMLADLRACLVSDVVLQRAIDADRDSRGRQERWLEWVLAWCRIWDRISKTRRWGITLTMAPVSKEVKCSRWSSAWWRNVVRGSAWAWNRKDHDPDSAAVSCHHVRANTREV